MKKIRGKLLHILRQQFNKDEQLILFHVPYNKRVTALLAHKYGVSNAAISARKKKLINRLRRHLKVGEFSDYIHVVSSQKSS